MAFRSRNILKSLAKFQFQVFITNKRNHLLISFFTNLPVSGQFWNAWKVKSEKFRQAFAQMYFFRDLAALGVCSSENTKSVFQEPLDANKFTNIAAKGFF